MMNWTIGALVLIAMSPGLPPKEPKTTFGRAAAAKPIRRVIRLPAPPKITAAEIATEFVRYASESSDWGAEAKRFVAQRAAELGPAGPPADFIDACLAVLSGEFKGGLDLVFDEQTAKAADAFERLSRGNDPYLALAATKEGATAMIELEDVERCRAMLEDVMRHHKPFERFTLRPDHILFMLGYCQVQMLDYDEAAASFEAFVERYPSAPERLRITAAQILTELDRRAPGRIGDVRDLLGYARRRIGHGSTDEEVQARQAEAVALLDTLIEESEQKEKQGGDCDGSEKDGEKKEGQNPGGGQPQSGARQSSLPQGGEGKEARLRGQRARPGEAWGRMPPKEREQILQALQKQFPSRYRELIEQYYRELSKDGGGR